MSRESAFSLVEVITVAVIVLILIVIALPSFIESKTASELSLARIRLTAMKAAMENHLADWGSLPPDFNDPNELTRKYRGKFDTYGYFVCGIAANMPRSKGGLQFIGDKPGSIGSTQMVFYAPNIHCPLTTPVRYLSDNETFDPFGDGTVPFGLDSYPVESTDTIRYRIDYGTIASAGPDKIAGHWNRTWTSMTGCPRGSYPDRALPYSPTNGSKSCGELWTVVSACSSTIPETTCWADVHYPTRDQLGLEFPESDQDGDGLNDITESNGPNNGDANQDGGRDAAQPNVASLPDGGKGDYVTLVSPPGSLFSGVHTASAESIAGVTDGLEFPLGLVGFQVEGVPASGQCDVVLHPTQLFDWESYYKYGSLPDSATATWYSFVYDGTSGAEIDDTAITLHFLDGDRGDDDLIKNRIILDLGGPTGVGVTSVFDWGLYEQ